MADFAVWLKNRKASQDADLRALQDFAATQANIWPYGSNDIADYISLVTGNAAEAARNSLLTALARYYADWKATQTPPPGLWSRLGAATITHLSSVMLAVFGVLAGIIIVYGIFQGGFLTSLAQPSQARGFITFLFAFSTIAIFLLVAITTFWMEKDEVEARFSKAKDLLTLLIGIFGTILGFYFGSLNSDTNALSLANIMHSSTVAAGDPTTITATVLGGTAPVTYDLVVSDPTGAVNTEGMTVKDKPVMGGAIAQSVTIPANVIKPAGLNFTVIVHDAKGNRAQSAGTLIVEPKATAK